MQDIQIPGPFVVLQGVPGDGMCNTIDHLPSDILRTTSNSSSNNEDWHRACRRRENQFRDEWIQENVVQTATGNTSNTGGPFQSSTTSTNGTPSAASSRIPSDWMLTPEHNCVAVLSALPTPQSPRPVRLRPLWPGTVVTALELIALDSTDLSPLPLQFENDDDTENENPAVSYAMGRPGVLQLIRIDSTDDADDTNDDDTYAVVSVDGYHLMAPGVATDYAAQDDRWLWRVTCPDGAWVRQGLSLNSDCVSTEGATLMCSNTHHIQTFQIGTIPFGSLVTVYQKVVNDMALSRLQVEYKSTRGWCSEFLNPLSGQSGTILRPLPLTVPMQLRVVLPQGAVVRQSVELSSPIVSHLDVDAVVTVTQKAFSEHPAEQCVPRWRVAGDGWISLCLNTKEHEMVVVGLGTADPDYIVDDPASYHYRHGCSDIAANNSTASSTTTTTSSSSSNPPSRHNTEPCVICLTAERSATLVHGETGHVACCLMCARILKARKNVCPVCRLPIDSVIQHFWA